MEQIFSRLKALSPAAELLHPPYALRADGSLLCAFGQAPSDWQGIKKLSGSLALRWDGRVYARGWGDYPRQASAWRDIADIDSHGGIDLALQKNGSLCWLRRDKPSGLCSGYLHTGWTNVESIHLCRDAWAGNSYADYAVGLCRGGGAEVGYIGGSHDRSREISALLNSLPGIIKFSHDCRVLAADGSILDFSTKGMGRVQKGPYIDFDVKYEEGLMAKAGGCSLLADGSIILPEGRYPAVSSEAWHDIIAISHGFCPDRTTDHMLMALRSDGSLLCAWEFDPEPIDTSGCRLFSSLASLPAQLDETRERCIAQGLRLEEEERIRADEREKLRREHELSQLRSRRADLYRQRQQLRGLFSGGKKRKLDEQIAALDKQLKNY